MDKLSKINEKITPLFNEDVYLYDINFVTRDGMYILEVQIDRKSSPVDLDLCSEVSQQISIILDELDIIAEDYYLEVCSAGAEKEIRNEEELQQALEKYVYVNLINPVNAMDEVLGTLKEISENEIRLEHFVKGVRKKTMIEKQNIAQITHAVKV